MNVEQIKDINNLVDINKKITNYKIKRLTAPGENYGSLMLSVDITVETPSGNEELPTVVKMVPPNDFMQEVFNTQITFRNEIGFYKNVVPTLEQFQREHGIEKIIDFSAKYYGSRLNLNGNVGKVDSDAALVLENLKVAGYTSPDRLEGLDLYSAKLVLLNLSKLHAVPLALRIQKPQIFEKEIKPYLATWKISEPQYKNMKKNILEVLEKTDKLNTLKERILTGFDRLLEEHEAREPFATVVHNDCWTNNNLFKFEGNTPVKNKLVDYQICNYGSPARDVVFFIFSSLKNEVISKHHEELLLFYFQNFLHTLQELKCDVTPFSFQSFLEEIDFEAKYSQFGHIAFMIVAIYAPHENTKEISEFTPENLFFEITDLLVEKYLFLCEEFAKRNWI